MQFTGTSFNREVAGVCVCARAPCVSVFVGLVGGQGAVQLQGKKMLMLTQALQLKMEWDFCKKLSITNGLE